MCFNSLGLSAEILSAIKEAGYEKPTSIQQQAIPAILWEKICWPVHRQEPAKRQDLFCLYYSILVRRRLS